MRTLVISPHADDETLGVGGTLLKRIEAGVEVAWLNVTIPSSTIGWDADKIALRQVEIQQVADEYKLSKRYQLNHQASELNSSKTQELISEISNVIESHKPEEMFIPHWSDAHSDHGYVFEAAFAASKWFRSPSLRRILCYETLSETNFPKPGLEPFQPNFYEDITDTFQKKLQIVAKYQSEILNHPFPRSLDSLTSLAKLRGSESGFEYAESFQLIYSRN